LVRAAQGGQARAFELLVERYERRATALAYRLVGNLHDAMEVCQDAFVRAYRSLGTLVDPERFSSWFLRIVTNLSLNFRRSRRSGVPRISFEDCLLDEDQSRDEVAVLPPHSDAHPETQAVAAELAEVVQQALAELPEQQRMALVLFSIEQMPQREVAEIMNCSVEAVKWHVFQARRKLRVQLADYLEGS
jgi:RNA polymerase sigma-70 factor (ECF subfamily)